MPMCGGLSASVQPSDEDKQRLTPVVKDYITQQIGQEPSDVKITEVSRQLVNGINHFLKLLNPLVMYLLHPTPTPPTEKEKERLLPPVKEYIQCVLGQVPEDLELLELVSELDKGCFYGVKVKFGDQLWHLQLYHSPIIYGIDIIALKHHEAPDNERLYPF